MENYKQHLKQKLHQLNQCPGVWTVVIIKIAIKKAEELFGRWS